MDDFFNITQQKHEKHEKTKAKALQDNLRDDSIEENQRKSKDSSMISTENSFSSISALEIENKHQFYCDFFNIYQ